MSDLASKTCCITGHRDIPVYDEQKILTRVRYIVEPLIREGVVYFGVGGAVGFDMFVTEYLLSLRDHYAKKISIISVLPYPGWRDNWPEEMKKREERILCRCNKITYVGREPSRFIYFERDRKLVDGSGYCVCYCNRMTGGTAYTVRYAMSKGVKVFNAGSWDLRQLGQKSFKSSS